MPREECTHTRWQQADRQSAVDASQAILQMRHSLLCRLSQTDSYRLRELTAGTVRIAISAIRRCTLIHSIQPSRARVNWARETRQAVAPSDGTSCDSTQIAERALPLS